MTEPTHVRRRRNRARAGEDARTSRVDVRVTPAELATLEAAAVAAGMALGAFVRAAALAAAAAAGPAE